MIQQDACHPQNLVASQRHTLFLLALVVLVAVTGTLLVRTSAAVPTAPTLGAYASLLVVQVGLVLYVTRVRLDVFRRLLGARPRLLDIPIALGVAFAIVGCESLFATSRASALLPHSLAERMTWFVVALAVGVGEEIVYRGYFRLQIGVTLQAVLFGIAHLEQGPAHAARIALYGLLLGLVAQKRQSLAPGMLAHVAIDLLLLARAG